VAQLAKQGGISEPIINYGRTVGRATELPRGHELGEAEAPHAVQGCRQGLTAPRPRRSHPAMPLLRVLPSPKIETVTARLENLERAVARIAQKLAQVEAASDPGRNDGTDRRRVGPYARRAGK
jgi:hypothetical protein